MSKCCSVVTIFATAIVTLQIAVEPVFAANVSCLDAFSVAAGHEKGASAHQVNDSKTLQASLRDGDLLEFWIAGRGTYRGHVVKINSGGSADAATFELLGQFGNPRTFSLDVVRDLIVLKDANGAALRSHTPVSGNEIEPALRIKKPLKGSYEDAVHFARDAHGPQVYTFQHYLSHLNSVVSVLTRFEISDANLRKAGILHDTLEDTPATYEEIRLRFGIEVADIVRAVTLPAGVPRAEAFEIAYPVIRNTPGALLIKLADRIANFEDAIKSFEEKGIDRYVKKYAKEWPHFRDSLSQGASPKAVEMISYLNQISEKFVER